MSTAMATTYENLILEIQDRVARVTINRPKVLNALNEKTVREIHAVFSSLRENQDVGVVILTGAGEKAFVAGADINELAVMTPLQGEASSKLGQAALREIETLGKALAAETIFGTVEAVKTVSDLYLPVAGTVTEVNPKLAGAPELVNTDPYGDGWMIKLTVDKPADLDKLMDAAAYGALVQA